jgi:hypothetical protein
VHCMLQMLQQQGHTWFKIADTLQVSAQVQHTAPRKIAITPQSHQLSQVHQRAPTPARAKMLTAANVTGAYYTIWHCTQFNKLAHGVCRL